MVTITIFVWFYSVCVKHNWMTPCSSSNDCRPDIYLTGELYKLLSNGVTCVTFQYCIQVLFFDTILHGCGAKGKNCDNCYNKWNCLRLGQYYTYYHSYSFVYVHTLSNTVRNNYTYTNVQFLCANFL